MSDLGIPIAIIIAAIIIIFGYGYFTSNPELFATTSTSTSTISSTTSTTTTTYTVTTTIPNVPFKDAMNETYYPIHAGLTSRPMLILGSKISVNGTLAWVAINKTNGLYVITNNKTAINNGGYNDSLTIRNTHSFIVLLHLECNSTMIVSNNKFYCNSINFYDNWMLPIINSGQNYSFTGVFNSCQINGIDRYCLNLTNVS